MLSLIKKLFSSRQANAEDILLYPKGKRFYPEFHNIRKNDLDSDALKVIGRLHQYSHKAYVVGGCVRDLLLARRPKDYDIVTSAKPNEVRKIFANSRLIGRRFRIVHVVFRNNKIIEVSTARSLPKSRRMAKGKDELFLKKDNEYGSFDEDAARRDFTVNSLFFDVRNETILDYTGGFDDLKQGIIRIIGDENISLPEDPVRMLRAIKFASTLDFKLDGKLEKGIRKHRKLIRKASKARLHEEYNKIFRTGQSLEIFTLMLQTGLFEAMFADLFKRLSENDENVETNLKSTILGKKLGIADRMIAEHEDINTTVYYALFVSEVVLPLVDEKKSRKQLSKEIRSRMRNVEAELSLTRKETDRLVDIFMAQSQFQREVKDKGQGWVKQFKNRDYFLEAFIFYKINARANEDNEAIQKALPWEIGMRKKLPNAIRKVTIKPLRSGSSSRSSSNSSNKGGGGGQRKQHRRRSRKN